jgi:hypothetical protein
MEGDVDCWANADGVKWEKRGTPAPHEPNTDRMNHAAGLANSGDLVVLCSDDNSQDRDCGYPCGGQTGRS